MSDVKLSGPHTDLPAPNCDGRWECLSRNGSVVSFRIAMKDGVPHYARSGAIAAVDHGDRWTLYVPADSVASPAVPADRPAPDREDGIYTTPAWSGWWIGSASNSVAWLMRVANGRAFYSDGVESLSHGWRPAPIADPSEVERLKAEPAASEARRKADRETANREWQKCGYALDDAGIPIGDGAVYSRIGVLATQRDEARAALEAERAKVAGLETGDVTVTRLIEFVAAAVALRHGDAESRTIENLIANVLFVPTTVTRKESDGAWY